jgi:hypothetical protein
LRDKIGIRGGNRKSGNAPGVLLYCTTRDGMVAQFCITQQRVEVDRTKEEIEKGEERKHVRIPSSK